MVMLKLAKHFRSNVSLALITTALGGTTAALGLDVDEDLSALTERVAAYWDARVIDDPITMYDFEFISFDGSVSLRDYVRINGQLSYNSATLKDLEQIDEDTAIATVEVEYKVPGMGGDWLVSELATQWELADGLWYHVGQPTADVGALQDSSEVKDEH